MIPAIINNKLKNNNPKYPVIKIVIKMNPTTR
jgi:hypothetical protein